MGKNSKIAARDNGPDSYAGDRLIIVARTQGEDYRGQIKAKR